MRVTTVFALCAVVCLLALAAAPIEAHRSTTAMDRALRQRLNAAKAAAAEMAAAATAATAPAATVTPAATALIAEEEQAAAAEKEKVRTQVVRLSDSEYVKYEDLFDHSEQEDVDGSHAAQEAAEDAAAESASNSVLGEEQSAETPQEQQQQQQRAHAPEPAASVEEMRFRAQREQGIWDSIKNGAKKVVGAVKSLFSSKKDEPKDDPKKGGAKAKPITPNDIEDCVACRMVWKQVEQQVGNARFMEDVMASFERVCMEAQKSTIFFSACNDMYNDLAAFTDDYMSNKYLIGTMCKRGDMCKSGKLEFPKPQ